MAANLRQRTGAYRAIFWSSATVDTPAGPNPAAEIVLRDLARICYMGKTTANDSAIAMAAAEGRRQVWLYIKQQLSLTDDQIDRILNQ